MQHINLQFIVHWLLTFRTKKFNCKTILHCVYTVHLYLMCFKRLIMVDLIHLWSYWASSFSLMLLLLFLWIALPVFLSPVIVNIKFEANSNFDIFTLILNRCRLDKLWCLLQNVVYISVVHLFWFHIFGVGRPLYSVEPLIVDCDF